MCIDIASTGFSATLEIREDLDNEFAFFQSWETQGIWGNTPKNQGEFRKFGSDPKRKVVFGFVVFTQCEWYTTLQTITIGYACFFMDIF